METVRKHLHKPDGTLASAAMSGPRIPIARFVRDSIGGSEMEGGNMNPDSLDSTVQEERVKDMELLSCIKAGGCRLPAGG